MLKTQAANRYCTYLLPRNGFFCSPCFRRGKHPKLESKTSDLAGQLAGINQELVAISDQISTTEMQVEITNGEIQRTKDSLADAQAKEAQQYNDMKTRIKYMYETGSASLLEMLFSAEDMTDFLNKADFIQNISDYDRKMLTELQETKKSNRKKRKRLFRHSRIPWSHSRQVWIRSSLISKRKPLLLLLIWLHFRHSLQHLEHRKLQNWKQKDSRNFSSNSSRNRTSFIR